MNTSVERDGRHLLPVAGGVPIVTADGEVIGAIGVGGADDVTDDRIAQQARDSVTKIVAWATRLPRHRRNGPRSSSPG
ncbi:heme-binding protein [Streptomyces sp. MNU76]|nr:heme-binding protein [Streptomyces sp. MNU76]